MARGPARLWDKGMAVDELVHRFTVGDDPIRDAALLHDDCVASAAHVRTLLRSGMISGGDAARLVRELARIDRAAAQGRFQILPEQEDCHTAIESHLTRRLGDAGARIHTGRSRNDQVAAAMRLYMRRQAAAWQGAIAEFCGILLARMRQEGDLPLPGYTHLQPAMPSSFGQWLHAWIEGMLEQAAATEDLLKRLDACPLGSGAGFGVPAALDRAETARLLGFARVQRSPIDVQNSRGRLETYAVRVAADAAALLEKMSWDLLLFSTAEFGFVRLPAALTTGSSIMPQKQNPDVLELLRGRSARLRARVFELGEVCGKLPSSYHRDLQLTKEPLMRTAQELPDLLSIAGRVVAAIRLDPVRLAGAMRPELYATHAALDRVRQGVPFRRAYRDVAEELARGSFAPAELPRWREEDGRVDGSILRELSGEVRAHAVRAARTLRRFEEVDRAMLDASDLAAKRRTQTAGHSQVRMRL